jgi:predicted nucleotidyltransferase
VFAPKGILSASPLQAPIEVKLHTGQAAGLSNGVNEILQKVRSEKISRSIPKEIVALYLYGSSVTGKLRKESDIDVAFLPSHKTSEEERLILMAKVEGMVDKLLREMGISREISILDLRAKYVSVSLQYRVITEGILIYEKDALQRYEFENAVKREYFDFVPYLNFLRKRKYGHLFQKI